MITRLRRPITSAIRWMLLCVLVACGPAAAYDLPSPAKPGLTQWSHRAWLQTEGAPGSILALAQTPDGWLWIGTPRGLYRFDGTVFDRVDELGGVPVASLGVRSLTVDDRTGALWIGYLRGGVGVYRQGRLTHYGSDAGLTSSTVGGIAVDRAGRVYAAATNGLYELHGARWRRVHPEMTLVTQVFVDRRDALWIVSTPTLWMWKRGEAPRAVDTVKFDDVTGFAQAPDGSVWLYNLEGGLRRFGADGARLPVTAAMPRGPVGPLLFDQYGMAWWSEVHSGLHRDDPAPWSPAVRDGDRTQGPGERGAYGETGDGIDQTPGRPQILSMLRDRQGAVWVGGNKGLSRYVPYRFVHLEGLQDAGYMVIAPADGGGAWIGAAGLPLRRAGPAAAEWPQLVTGYSALYADAAGVLWAASRSGNVWRVDGADVLPADTPPRPEGSPSRPVVAIVHDAEQRLWLARETLWRRQAGQWVAIGGQEGLATDTVNLLTTSDGGRTVWIGYRGGRVDVHRGGQARMLVDGAVDGLGDVAAVLPVAQDRVWVGGERGAGLVAQGRWRPLRGDRPLRGVTGIVQRPDGELWLNVVDGVVRVDREDVRRFMAGEINRVPFEVFDEQDGIGGGAPQIGGFPTMFLDEDERLWIAYSGGVATVDPATLPRDATAPAVSILGLESDGDVRSLHGAVLPAHTRGVRVSYAGLSIASAERVHYRYRMRGLDDRWREAGRARSASFGNLGPGDYTFEVMAANGDGVWSTVPATVQFRIRPAFTETWAFRALVVTAAVGCLVAAYLLRVREIARRARREGLAIQRERERIGGELHDTVLQSVYALLLRLQAVIDRTSDHQQRALLTEAVARTEAAIEEGRERLSGLRLTSHDTENMQALLERMTVEVAAARGLRSRVQVEGPAWRLRPMLREELFLIAREAVTNAVRHAEASAVSVRLECREQYVLLAVRDDGKGIDGDAGGDRPVGHWGLRIMRQRATRIGAQLLIGASSHGGTSVKVLLQSREAYDGDLGSGWGLRWRWWRRRTGSAPVVPDGSAALRESP